MEKHMRSASLRVLLVLLLPMLGCPAEGPPSGNAPVGLQYASGDEQCGAETAVLAEELAVRVVDAQGVGVQGVAVTFAVEGGGGTVEPASAVSDAEGYVRAAWTLGSAGEQRLSARAAQVDAPIIFHSLAIQAPRDSMPAEEIAREAGRIYEGVKTGGDVGGMIAQVFGRFCVPVLRAETDGARIERRTSAGLPVLLDLQVAAMARSYADGTRVPLSSMISAFAENGARQKDPAGPLTLEGLTESLTAFSAQPAYAPGEQVLAFILTLGRERAALTAGGPSDPVWGDGWLDPLQMTLLTYAIHFATPSASGQATEAAPLSWRSMVGGDNEEGGFFDWRAFVKLLGRKLEFPVTVDQAVRSSLCVSIVLNGYKFTVSSSKDRLVREVASTDASTISAVLMFVDTYPQEIQSLMRKYQCELPKPGASSGKEVTWAITGALPDHGKLRDAQEQTNDSGQATAVYETLPGELIPEELRILRKDETGTVDVRAKGMVPGWRGLEAAVGVGIYNPVDEGTRLFVSTWRLPDALDLSWEVLFDTPEHPPGQYLKVGGHGAIRMTKLRDGGGYLRYEGTEPMTYDVFDFLSIGDDCVGTSAGTRSGWVKGALTLNHGAFPGRLVGYLEQDLHLPPRELVQLTGDCSGLIESEYLATFLVFRGYSNPIRDWVKVDGTLQRQYSFTWSDLREESSYTLTPVFFLEPSPP
jgi:hypothetical protein